MKFSWKHFNIALLLLVLATNLILNIWFLVELSLSVTGFGATILFEIFFYFVAPFMIVISALVVYFLKSKFIEKKRKIHSLAGILFVYGCSLLIYFLTK